jgi:predicted CopG family antitoxin
MIVIYNINGDLLQKKKDKKIKVTDEVHHELGQIGRLTEDYGDVVERLIKFYREHGGGD